MNIFLVLLNIFIVVIIQYKKYGYYLQIPNKIELLNDFDIFRDEDTDEPVIIMNRLNDFLLTIGEKNYSYSRATEILYHYKIL